MGMKDALMKKAKEMEMSASEEVVVSAYTTPTLRSLGLIDTKEENELRLTLDGERIVSSFEAEGEPGAAKKLCSLLLLKDPFCFQLDYPVLPFEIERIQVFIHLFDKQLPKNVTNHKYV